MNEAPGKFFLYFKQITVRMSSQSIGIILLSSKKICIVISSAGIDIYSIQVIPGENWNKGKN